MRDVFTCVVCQQPCLSERGRRTHISKTHDGINRIRNRIILDEVMGNERPVSEIAERFALSTTQVYTVSAPRPGAPVSIQPSTEELRRRSGDAASGRDSDHQPPQESLMDLEGLSPEQRRVVLLLKDGDLIRRRDPNPGSVFAIIRGADVVGQFRPATHAALERRDIIRFDHFVECWVTETYGMSCYHGSFSGGQCESQLAFTPAQLLERIEQLRAHLLDRRKYRRMPLKTLRLLSDISSAEHDLFSESGWVLTPEQYPYDGDAHYYCPNCRDPVDDEPEDMAPDSGCRTCGGEDCLRPEGHPIDEFDGELL